jgi:prophage regulatory protein
VKFEPLIPTPNALLRIDTARTLTGDSAGSFYKKIAAGLLTRPIKTGARSCVVPFREVDAINAARIRGADENEIKALVDQLHADRAHVG